MTSFVYSKLVKVTLVFFRSIFFYNYVCWNLKKKLWYVIWSNVCFIFMRLSLTLTVLILILHDSHWGLTSNRMLTCEIKLLGCPCDLMPERLLFLKIKVMIFFQIIFTKKIYLPFAFCQKIFLPEVSDSCVLCTVISTRQNLQAKKYYRQLFLILVVANFNICKAAFGWKRARFNTREIQCSLKLVPLKYTKSCGYTESYKYFCVSSNLFLLLISF